MGSSLAGGLGRVSMAEPRSRPLAT